jgi:copper chaperone
METRIQVEGMHCGHCRQTVRSALKAVGGVDDAEVSLETGVARVRHLPSVTVRDLLEAVKSCGYGAVQEP